MTENEGYVRLSKVMVQRGMCSRREADAYIEKGEVLVNGEVVSVLGTKIDPDAEVELNTRAKRAQKVKVTILLNKPLGIVSTQLEKGHKDAIQLITRWNQEGGRRRFQPSIFTELTVVGQLDIDSKGLLVLTQDGVLAKKIIGPDSEMEKEYLVRVEGSVSEEMIERLRFGLSLDGKQLKKARIEMIEPDFLRFVLWESKKRQIRRMCDLVGLKVVKLKRVRIGNVCLGDLPEGKWRFLSRQEKF